MNVDMQSIYGFQVGFEIADKDTLETFNLPWGFTLELGVVRFVFQGDELEE
jgi:hypothetical protein